MVAWVGGSLVFVDALQHSCSGYGHSTAAHASQRLVGQEKSPRMRRRPPVGGSLVAGQSCMLRMLTLVCGTLACTAVLLSQSRPVTSSFTSKLKQTACRRHQPTAAAMLALWSNDVACISQPAQMNTKPRVRAHPSSDMLMHCQYLYTACSHGRTNWCVSVIARRRQRMHACHCGSSSTAISSCHLT